jgi:hypothetical protein
MRRRHRTSSQPRAILASNDFLPRVALLHGVARAAGGKTFLTRAKLVRSPDRDVATSRFGCSARFQQAHHIFGNFTNAKGSLPDRQASLLSRPLSHDLALHGRRLLDDVVVGNAGRGEQERGAGQNCLYGPTPIFSGQARAAPSTKRLASFQSEASVHAICPCYMDVSRRRPARLSAARIVSSHGRAGM